MSYHESVHNTETNTMNEFIIRFTKKTSVDVNEYDDNSIEFIFNKTNKVMVPVTNKFARLPTDIGHHAILIIACVLQLKDIKMENNFYVTNGVLNDDAYRIMLTFAYGIKKRKTKKSKKQRKIKKKSKTFRRFA